MSLMQNDNPTLTATKKDIAGHSPMVAQYLRVTF